MRRSLATLLALAILAVARPAAADLEFGVDQPRIFAIQERPYELRHEFQLGVGVLPMDAFYTGLTLGFSYTLHFTDFWAWEIFSFNYSLNVDSGLAGGLEERFGVKPVGGGGEQIQLFMGSHAVFKPFFGKLVLFNAEIVYAETFFTVGIGPFRSVSGDGSLDFWDPAASVGVGLRLWITDFLSTRVEIKPYFVFKDIFGGRNDIIRAKGVDTTLLFQLSVSFNISPDDEEDEEAVDDDGEVEL